MKLLSCNVNGRVGAALTRQMSALLDREPDVLALQEVTSRTYAAWCEGLLNAGYAVVSSVDLLEMAYPPPPYSSPPFPRNLPRESIEQAKQIKRTYFNLTAARHPIALLPGLLFEDPDEAQFAFPEKYVAAGVFVDGVQIDVHNAHLPPGVSRGVIKVHAFEAIRRRVDADAPNPRILCGDFNAPWSEDDNGPVVQRRDPVWGEAINARWTLAEERLIANPEMRDVYRDVHQAGQPFPASHFTGRVDRRTAHRYDRIFASSAITTEGCTYLCDWLDEGVPGGRLSDHAPVEARLSLAGHS